MQTHDPVGSNVSDPDVVCPQSRPFSTAGKKQRAARNALITSALRENSLRAVALAFGLSPARVHEISKEFAQVPLVSGRPMAKKAPTVVLGDPGDVPRVRGVAKPRLTRQQFQVVSALLRAGTKGLTEPELRKESLCGDARGVLKRLAKDADWRRVIRFPKTTRGGSYRIEGATRIKST